VEYVDVPDAAALDAMVGSGVPQWFAEQLVRVFGRLRAGAADRVTDDVRALTGREPRTLARFLRDHAAAALAA
jgi:hypothetical protein